MSTKTPNALLHGTLDALSVEDAWPGNRAAGYAIARFIEEASGE